MSHPWPFRSHKDCSRFATATLTISSSTTTTTATTATTTTTTYPARTTTTTERVKQMCLVSDRGISLLSPRAPPRDTGEKPHRSVVKYALGAVRGSVWKAYAKHMERATTNCQYYCYASTWGKK